MARPACQSACSSRFRIWLTCAPTNGREEVSRKQPKPWMRFVWKRKRKSMRKTHRPKEDIIEEEAEAIMEVEATAGIDECINLKVCGTQLLFIHSELIPIVAVGFDSAHRGRHTAKYMPISNPATVWPRRHSAALNDVHES